MERDCILSHGLTAVLKERLMKVSDSFTATICGRCGLLVNRRGADELPMCRTCKEVKYDLFRKVEYGRWRFPMRPNY